MSNQIRRARTCDVAFTYRMPAGIPGAVTRVDAGTTIEPNVIDSSNAPTAYGIAVAIDGTAHQIRPIGASDTIANVYGLLVRPYPTSITTNTDGLGTSTPPTSGVCSVLKRGYMTVKVNYGTAVKNGAVYVRTVADGNSSVVGGFDAQSDSSNSFALTNAYWNGPADSNGNAEIAFNL